MTVNALRTAASPARDAEGTGRDTGRTAFTQSIARRMPWKLVIRVAIAIAAMTGIAYHHVFSVVTGKSPEQLGGGIEVETGLGHHTTAHLWVDPSTALENTAA